MTPSWYRIQARGAKPKSAEVFIFGDIGESWFAESITAASFVRDLADLGDVDTLTIRINSIGGSVIDGLAIYNALRRHPADVHVSVEGIAASIASLIAMAGDTVEMAENARLMVHAPWGSANGNAQKLREFADQLDDWSESMASCYVAKTGKPRDEMLALLKDGTDHWYSADEAVDFGFADTVGAPMAVAAALRAAAASRYPNFRAAERRIHEDHDMSDFNELDQDLNTPSGLSRSQIKAAARTAATQAAAEQARIEAEYTRRQDVARMFNMGTGRFGDGDRFAGLRAACLADPDVTAAIAGERILVEMGRNASPANGGFVYTVEAEADKARKGIMAALEHRAGLAKDDSANPYRSESLIDFARGSLQRAGVRVEGGKMQVVAAAFSHSTSDFPTILEGVANKSMLKGYDEAPETFPLWTAKGSLPDFKVGKRVDLNAFPALQQVAEGAEFQYATIGERGESIVLGTYGALFSITRQAIINDDLSAFTRLPQAMGRSARRTVGDGVYAILTGNPAMSDTVALFHSTHKNLGTAGVISTDSVGEMQTRMALQKDAGGAATLNIALAHLIVPVGLAGRANVVRASQFYVGATEMSATMPNSVNGAFTVIADPRLDAHSVAGWYGCGNPAMFDTIEVAYLDGIETPFLDRQQGWTVDGVELKVRLDFGIKALDFRALAKNAGG